MYEERAKEETTPILKIYWEKKALSAKATDESEVAIVLPTFQSIRIQLYNKRREWLSPLLSSVEVHFDGE